MNDQDKEKTAEKRMVTIKEAATVTGLALGSVYRIIRKRRVKMIKEPGEFIKISLDELLEYRQVYGKYDRRNINRF